ncbi:hypothetical protein ABZV31_26955 [Streptomyces sp. NPDC005202]|uniref:hypothetical protein n=1 Tax=Streptomyces sp. NPDC005202 TaxID=3157021 RepID=UPI0033A79487
MDHNTAYAHADYSRESAEQAWDNMKQGWKDAGRDMMTSNSFVGGVPIPVNPQQLSGMSDEQYEAMLDKMFGPSPEERARAAEQQGGGAG